MNARARWTVVVALALAVLVASLVPGGGRRPLGPFGVLGLDKWIHAVAYATLAATVAFADGRALRAGSSDAAARSGVVIGAAVGVAAAVAYGLFVELLQLGVPYRSASALDAVANLVGAVVGATVLVAVARVYRYYDGWASARSTPER